MRCYITRFLCFSLARYGAGQNDAVANACNIHIRTRDKPLDGDPDRTDIARDRNVETSNLLARGIEKEYVRRAVSVTYDVSAAR